MKRIRNRAIAVALIGVVAVFVVTNAQKSGRAAREIDGLVAAAGCTPVQTLAIEGSKHISAPAKAMYKTEPPTSGEMYAGVGPTGVASQPIDGEVQVHNLEHGHIGIQYKDQGDPLVDKLLDVVRGNPTRVFLAPRPQLTAKLAISGWGRLVTCPNPNDKAVEVARKFVEAFAGKGGEGDAPGTPQGV